MSIFKKIKKGWKKLGSSIAKRMRTVGRGVKKGFAKITKAFGKLGPLGHLALFFILPGVGNALTSWMGQMGSSVMNMLPEGFANVLTSVGNGIKSAASFAYNNTVGAVYNTVSNALTAGIDFVTKPFMEAGSKGLATSFKDFVGETAAKFSATPPVEFNLPDTLPDAATPGIFDEGYKLPKESTPGVFDKEYKLPKGDFPKGTTDTSKLLEMDPDTKGIFRKGVDKLANVKDTVRNKDILGTGVSVGEAVGVSKDATQVFTAYKYFNPDDVESGFYNPNIGMANALNQSTTNPYTTSGENANFVNLNNVPSSPDQQASFYASMFGPVGNDPYAAAMNAPGYGFGFEDYITGA
jgi:hypothetical protein